MKHYYPNVPGLGNVALSRHAQNACAEQGIGDSAIESLLLNGSRVDVEGGNVQVDHAGIRCVIVRKPVPFSGAALMVTAFRLGRPARVRR